MLQHNPELKSQIEQLWNKFWAGGLSNPLTAIEQITYLLFMKRLDEMDLKNQSDAEFTAEPYTSLKIWHRHAINATVLINSPKIRQITRKILC